MMLLLAAGCKRPSDNVTTPLHRAVAEGDVDQMQLLLHQGADVDAKDFSGKTPLFIAVSQRPEMVPLLLDNGAYINASDKWGYSVLHGALRGYGRGAEDVAELLLARGAYVRTQSQDGETPLHEAARRGWTKLAKLLIAKGADINVAARNGNTPLLCTILDSGTTYREYGLDYKRMEVVRFLIAKGADVNAMNRAGETSLSCSAQSGDLDLAQLLMDSGAQPNRAATPDRAPAILAMNRNHIEVTRFLIARGADVTLHLAAYIGDLEKAQALVQNGSDVNARGQAGETPLHMAACAGHRDLAELLINSGADVNAQAGGGWTALHEAARSGHEDVAELLIAHGAMVNAGTRPSDDRMLVEHLPGPHGPIGTTPLHLAVRYPEVAKLLVANGADVNAKDENGDTAILRAAVEGNKQVVDMLIAAGADMDLHLAAYTGHVEDVKRLIEAGRDVNGGDDDGRTPLYLAVLGGHADVVEVLTSSGANPNATYDDNYYGRGQTPLHKAAQMDDADVARVLITHGANVRAQDRSGDTPLHAAAYFGSTSVVEVLLAHGADPNVKTTDGKTALDYAQEAGFADVARLLGGNIVKLARGPYRVIITDPNAIRAFVDRNMNVDGVWIPDEAQLKEFEVALKAYLEENTAPAGANEHVLAHLRRFNREFAGLTSKGRRYIICNLDLGELDKNPPDNHFTHDRTDAWWTITHVVFDVETKTIIRVEPT